MKAALRVFLRQGQEASKVIASPVVKTKIETCKRIVRTAQVHKVTTGAAQSGLVLICRK